MTSLIGRRPGAFAILYVIVSLLVETVLIVVLRWRVPEDNARIAPAVLTIPPMLAAWLSGYRRPLKDFLTVAELAAILTLLITIIVSRLSGVSTGLVEPIVNRSAAGWLAALITNRATSKSK